VGIHNFFLVKVRLTRPYISSPGIGQLFQPDDPCTLSREKKDTRLTARP
jgi:hypothetical protein